MWVQICRFGGHCVYGSLRRVWFLSSSSVCVWAIPMDTPNMTWCPVNFTGIRGASLTISSLLSVLISVISCHLLSSLPFCLSSCLSASVRLHVRLFVCLSLCHPAVILACKAVRLAFTFPPSSVCLSVCFPFLPLTCNACLPVLLFAWLYFLLSVRSLAHSPFLPLCLSVSVSILSVSISILSVCNYLHPVCFALLPILCSSFGVRTLSSFFTCLSVCLSGHLFALLSFLLFVSLSVLRCAYLSFFHVCLFGYLFILLSFLLSVCLSVHLFALFSFLLPVCLCIAFLPSVCLSVCLSVSVSFPPFVLGSQFWCQYFSCVFPGSLFLRRCV